LFCVLTSLVQSQHNNAYTTIKHIVWGSSSYSVSVCNDCTMHSRNASFVR
jgi:hypothetical protein